VSDYPPKVGAVVAWGQRGVFYVTERRNSKQGPRLRLLPADRLGAVEWAPAWECRIIPRPLVPPWRGK
jgi:hypothetical protein